MIYLTKLQIIVPGFRDIKNLIWHFAGFPAIASVPLVLLFVPTNAGVTAIDAIPPVRHRPEQNRVTWETPSSEAIPLLQEPIGVLASYATHNKRRYEANKCG